LNINWQKNKLFVNSSSLFCDRKPGLWLFFAKKSAWARFAVLNRAQGQFIFLFTIVSITGRRLIRSGCRGIGLCIVEAFASASL